MCEKCCAGIEWAGLLALGRPAPEPAGANREADEPAALRGLPQASPARHRPARARTARPPEETAAARARPRRGGEAAEKRAPGREDRPHGSERARGQGLQGRARRMWGQPPPPPGPEPARGGPRHARHQRGPGDLPQALEGGVAQFCGSLTGMAAAARTVRRAARSRPILGQLMTCAAGAAAAAASEADPRLRSTPLRGSSNLRPRLPRAGACHSRLGAGPRGHGAGTRRPAGGLRGPQHRTPRPQPAPRTSPARPSAPGSRPPPRAPGRPATSTASPSGPAPRGTGFHKRPTPPRPGARAAALGAQPAKPTATSDLRQQRHLPQPAG